MQSFDSIHVLIGLEGNVASTVDAIDTSSSGVSKFEKIRLNVEVTSITIKLFFCCLNFVK